MFEKLLSTRINFTRVFLTVLVLTLPTIGSVSLFGGMFGISIPANYGKWFTSIYNLYVQNQDLIMNARKLYTTYLSVTQAIDALEGFGEAREIFQDRWETNVRVLLEANIYWTLDEDILEGSFDVRSLLRQLFGVDFDDDQVTIKPELINLATVAIVGDPSKWSSFLIDHGPGFGSWFAPDDLLRAMANEYLGDQARYAYTNMGRKYQERVKQLVYERIVDNPMAYLLCDDQEYPCWSPFFSPEGTAWSWDQMLIHMYDYSSDLHQPFPLDDEVTSSGTLADYDAYLHRRVCSAVWKALGYEIKDKVESVHRSFARKRFQISAAIADAQYLARFLQDVLYPLDNWNPTTNTSLAKTFATSFLIDADGGSKEISKARAWLDGVIDKKIDIVLTRAEEVGQQMDSYLTVFQRVLDDIEKSEKRGHRSRGSRWFLNPQTHAWSLYHSNRPPASLINETPAFKDMANRVREAVGGL